MQDDKPESDLTAIVSGVKATLKPRLLSNGRLYCAELARTEDEQDECMGDLEDTLFKSESDKARAVDLVSKHVTTQRVVRRQCKWYQAKITRREWCKGK